jgi:chorismate mutase
VTNLNAMNNLMTEQSVRLCIRLIYKTKDDKAINKVRFIMNTAKILQKFWMTEVLQE